MKHTRVSARRPRLTPPAAVTTAAASASGSPMRLLPLVPYTAASALFALPHTTDASVIYTDLIPDTVLAPGQTESAAVSFNLNGGGNDFRVFLNRENSTNGFVAGYARLDAIGNQILFNGSFLVRKLASGAGISAGAANGWGQGIGYLCKASGSFGYVGPIVGSWLPGQVGFAGLRLNAGGGNYNYGWMRMKVDDVDSNGTPDKLTIFDYGYEALLNTPVTAGDMVGVAPVPEASTALFGVAMAGAAALRRKRQVAAAA